MKMQMAIQMIHGEAGGMELCKLRLDFEGELLAGGR